MNATQEGAILVLSEEKATEKRNSYLVWLLCGFAGLLLLVALIFAACCYLTKFRYIYMSL